MQTEAIDPLFGPWASEAALRLLAGGGELPAGQRLGPYVIEARLGSGGMGDVYVGEDTRLNRRVAVKLLDAWLRGDEIGQRRFAAEARTIANLHHPNICTLYDIGEHAGEPYLVMELLEGETLAQRLRRGPLPI